MTWRITIGEADEQTNALLDSDLHHRNQELLYAGLNDLLAMVGPEPSDIRAGLEVMLEAAASTYQFAEGAQVLAQALREQRDEALLDADYWQKRGTSNATNQIAANIGHEAQIKPESAALLLEMLQGTDGLPVDETTRRRFFDRVRTMTDELIAAEQLEEELFYEDEEYDYD